MTALIQVQDVFNPCTDITYNGYLIMDPESGEISCNLCGRIHDPAVGGRLL